MRYVTLDFETYWRSADYTLSKLGPIEYIRDERFYAQLMSYRIDEGETQVVEHDVIPHALASLNLTDPNVAVIAHNGSGFDFMILSERYGVHPANMYDTICMARWCGVARFTRESHAALTDWFGHGIKQAGTVVSDGKKTREEFTPEEWAFFKQYCKDDTTQCSENFFAMLPYVSEDALKFMSLTAKMATEPAFRLNTLALRDYINELSDKEEEARKAIAYMFHFPTTETMLKAIRSPLKFCDMLRSLGVEPPMKYSETQTATAVKKMKERRDAITALFKESDGGRTLEPAMRQQLMAEFAEIAKKLGGDEDDLKVYTPALSKQDLPFLALRDHPDLRVQQLVNMRLEHNSSILMSRAKTFYKLANQSPRPLPILLKTFYAHTSRYGAGNSEGASDGTNAQNLSKRNPQTLQIRQAIYVPKGYAVVACDSSQIEARMLAYIAQEKELLKHFREGGDPYAELAAKTFGVSAQEIHDGAKAGDKRMKKYRNVGKLGVLSAGYAVGKESYSNTLLRQGIKLDPDLEKHRELAYHAHMVYRLSNPSIVALWKRCQGICEHMATMTDATQFCFGGPTDQLFTYGLCTVTGSDKVSPRIQMPSGYSIWYPDLSIERSESYGMRFGKDYECMYSRIRGKTTQRIRLFGASMVENVTQGIAFQLLMWQACRMEECGIKLHCNIHDSFATVVPEEQAEAVKRAMELCMSAVPPWLPGFPVACEAEIGTDFTIV